MTSTTIHAATSLALTASLALAACQASPVEPTPDKPADKPAAAADHGAKPTQGGVEAPKTYRHPIGGAAMKRPVNTVQPSPDDPLKGNFTLDDATHGLPPGKQLLATIETSMGKIECKLYDDKAPITVANFVGLARGVRPGRRPRASGRRSRPTTAPCSTASSRGS